MNDTEPSLTAFSVFSTAGSTSRLFWCNSQILGILEQLLSSSWSSSPILAQSWVRLSGYFASTSRAGYWRAGCCEIWRYHQTPSLSTRATLVYELCFSQATVSAFAQMVTLAQGHHEKCMAKFLEIYASLVQSSASINELRRNWLAPLHPRALRGLAAGTRDI